MKQLQPCLKSFVTTSSKISNIDKLVNTIEKWLEKLNICYNIWSLKLLMSIHNDIYLGQHFIDLDLSIWTNHWCLMPHKNWDLHSLRKTTTFNKDSLRYREKLLPAGGASIFTQ